LDNKVLDIIDTECNHEVQLDKLQRDRWTSVRQINFSETNKPCHFTPRFPVLEVIDSDLSWDRLSCSDGVQLFQT